MTKIILNLRYALFALIFLGSAAAAFEPVPLVAPESEAVFDDFTMTVDGHPTSVLACRVSAWPINQTWPGYQRPLDQTEMAGFARWEMSEKVRVEITTRRKIESVTVRPLSLEITPQIEGDKIAFDLDRAVPVVVEVNGYHGALHLFPHTPQSAPADKNASGLYYFGAGVHDVGVLKLKSGERVYLDAGAFVYGSIFAENADDIRIEGPGLIDASRFSREKDYCGCLRFVHCKNVHVDGPILRDPDVWTVNVFDCDDVEIRHLALIGLWRYNADGIDVCNSRNVLVENVFVRAFDDALVLKGLPSFHEKPNQNVTFRGCTVWCDWGRALELGAETCAPEDANIVYENCDVIRSSAVVMDVQHYDEANVHDIRFENIRVEYDSWCARELYQMEKDQKYVVNNNDNYMPLLMVIVMPEWRAPWSSEKHGIARNIVFKDITVYAEKMPPSSFSGFTAEHNVDGVLVENVRLAGQESSKTAEELNLKIGPFVENIEIR